MLLVYSHVLLNTLRSLQADIDRIQHWARSNGLILNEGKTKCMILGTGRFVDEIDLNVLPRLKIQGKDIDYVSNAKNLGLHIDSKLTWKLQVEHVCAAVWKTLRQLRYNSSSLNRNLRSNLVSSLIFPLFDYCCVTMTNISQELELQLQKAMNACVRFVTRSRYGEHMTPYLNQLQWLSVANRRKFYQGTIVFNAIHDRCPSYIGDQFFMRSFPVQRRLRVQADPLLLNIPFARLEYYKKSFIISSCEFWNSLPLTVRQATSLDTFKERLRGHLLLLQAT